MNISGSNSIAGHSTFVVAIRDLKCNHLPSVGLFKRAGKTRLQIQFGDLKKTTATVNGSVGEWNEAFHFNVHGPGEMKIGVYVIQTMGSDLYVGGVKEPIDSFVTEEKQFTRPLITYDEQGGAHTSSTTIQFTMMVFPRPKQSQFSGSPAPSSRPQRPRNPHPYLDYSEDDAHDGLRARNDSFSTMAAPLTPLDLSPPSSAYAPSMAPAINGNDYSNRYSPAPSPSINGGGYPNSYSPATTSTGRYPGGAGAPSPLNFASSTASAGPSAPPTSYSMSPTTVSTSPTNYSISPTNCSNTYFSRAPSSRSSNHTPSPPLMKSHLPYLAEDRASEETQASARRAPSYRRNMTLPDASAPVNSYNSNLSRKASAPLMHTGLPQDPMVLAVHKATVSLERIARAPSSNALQLDSQAGDVRDWVSVNSSDSRSTVTLEGGWRPMMDKVQLFVKLMQGIPEVHPDAQMASSVLGIAYQVICALRARDEHIDRLVDCLLDVYTVVHESDPLKNIAGLAPVFAQVVQQTTECAYFIREYAKKKSFLARSGINIQPYVEKYESKLGDLRKAMQTGITVLRTAVLVTRVLDIVNSHVTAIDLEDMPYARGAHYNPEKICLPGTRERLIHKILDWANDDTDNAPRILLVHGEPGIGKSALANEVAHRFEALQRLGSSFFFERSHQADRRPDNVFSTIARDLAESDPQRKACLADAIKEKRSLRTTTSVREQFETFILQPALQLQAATFGPVIVVIDALDEAGSVEDRREVALPRSESKRRRVVTRR